MGLFRPCTQSHDIALLRTKHTLWTLSAPLLLACSASSAWPYFLFRRKPVLTCTCNGQSADEVPARESAFKHPKLI